MLRLLYLLLMLPSIVQASSVKTSEEFGYDATDATTFLRQAFNPNVSTADTIIIDYVDGSNGIWNTDQILVRRSNVTIILEPGVIVSGLAGAFEPTNRKLFVIRAQNNVHFIGYGATVQMIPGVSFAQGDPGGFRHLINFNGSDNISVIGLTLRDSGGDGIQVSRDTQGGRPFCTNVIIRDCFIDNNYRQGISITGARNVLIENCHITNTEGALPSSAIDFEPSGPEEVIQNCLVRNCRLTDNAGRGVQLGFGKNDPSSGFIDVTVEDTYIARNGTSNQRPKAGGITLNVGNNGISGHITLRNVLIEDQPYDGLYLKSEPSTVTVELDNVVIRNVSNFANEPNPDAAGDTIFRISRPIFVEVNFRNRTQPFGGISFKDVVIEQDQDIEYFYAEDNGRNDGTLEDITGNITVISPFTPSAFYGNGSQNNITLAATNLGAWPANTISIEVLSPDVPESLTDSGYFEFILGATTLGIPFPALYDISGAAQNRLDYSFSPGLRMIPAGTLAREFAILPRVDEEENEPIESVTFTLNNANPAVPSRGGATIATSATIFIGDALLPVEWGQVSSSVINNCGTAVVEWNTFSEANVESYTLLERKPLSEEWIIKKEDIQPGRFDYRETFSAKNLINGTAFRLRQNDFDGAVSYSPAAVLNNSCLELNEQVSIYPQPTNKLLFVNRMSDELGTVTLTDLNGRVVLERKTSSRLLELNLDLTPGFYLLTLDGDPTKVTKVIIN